jgi:hypothetical protein
MAGDDQSMTVKLPKIIATSVVRGSRRGGSHGGVYMVDFEKQEVEHYFNWNTSEIARVAAATGACAASHSVTKIS